MQLAHQRDAGAFIGGARREGAGGIHGSEQRIDARTLGDALAHLGKRAALQLDGAGAGMLLDEHAQRLGLGHGIFDEQYPAHGGNLRIAFARRRFCGVERLRSCFKANPVFTGFVVQQIGPFLHRPCTKQSPPSHAEARADGDGSPGDIRGRRGRDGRAGNAGRRPTRVISITARRSAPKPADPQPSHNARERRRTAARNRFPANAIATCAPSAAPPRRSDCRGCWRLP